MKLLRCLVIALLLHNTAITQVVPLDNMWITNGSVLCSEAVGDTLYIGGSFSHVGPQNYNGVIIDAATGAPRKTNMHPNNIVRSVTTDGQGGWIIGGEFQVMGQSDFRSGIARLNADGSLHAWNPSINGSILKVLKVQDTLFVAGTFTMVNEEPRNKLAAFKISTGELLPWNPNPAGDVFDIDYFKGEVIAGGNFTQIGGEARSGLAALHPVTAQVTPWKPLLVQPFTTPIVNNLIVQNGLLFVSGFFEEMDGLERMRLAAIDLETKQTTPWNPQPNSNVHAILVHGDKIYAGGTFDQIGGKQRNGLARLNNTDGQVDDWNPMTGAGNHVVHSLLMYEEKLLVGGNFTFVQDSARQGLAAVHPDNGEVLAWNPNPSPGFVLDIVQQENTMFVAGSYQGIGGKNRSHLAGIKLPEGNATDFDAKLDGAVWSMTHENDTLYIGGAFQNANGSSRSRLAACKHSTGLLMPWNPGANGVVYSIATHGAHVYAGGEFSYAGDANRNNLAQILKSNGAATPWNPQPNGAVRALTTSNDLVYAGGFFFEIGGQTRLFLAALPHTGAGVPTAWAPNLNPGGRVLSFLKTDDKLYVGGSFQQIAGASRSSLALFDLPGHTLNEDFKPNFNGNINALALQENTLYAGGEFTSNFGLGNKDLVALHASNGAFTPWNPSGPLRIFTLQQRPESIIVGGQFLGIASRRVNNLAALPPDLTLPLRSLTLQAVMQQKQVQIQWQANEEDDVVHYHLERSLNGRDFARIATQYPTGTARHTHYDALLAHKQYYRVTALLKDGRSYSSNTSVVMGMPPGKGRIFPNPGNDNYLYYQSGELKPGLYQVSFINMVGQTITANQIQGGSNQIVALQVAGLPSGMYKVVLTDTKGTRVEIFHWIKL